MGAKVWDQLGAVDCNWGKDPLDNVRIHAFDMGTVYETLDIVIAPDTSDTASEDCLFEAVAVCSTEAVW
jgi:hypothetical protein